MLSAVEFYLLKWESSQIIDACNVLRTGFNIKNEKKPNETLLETVHKETSSVVFVTNFIKSNIWKCLFENSKKLSLQMKKAFKAFFIGPNILPVWRNSMTDL